jgi:hypothetical protein
LTLAAALTAPSLAASRARKSEYFRLNSLETRNRDMVKFEARVLSERERCLSTTSREFAIEQEEGKAIDCWNRGGRSSP